MPSLVAERVPAPIGSASPAKGDKKRARAANALAHPSVDGGYCLATMAVVLTDLRFPTEALRAAPGPLVAVHRDESGRPLAAVAAHLVHAPIESVWDVVSDVRSYPGRVPMLEKVELKGDRVVVKLRFGVSLFSAGFAFTADVKREERRSVELTHVAGEPDRLVLRYDLDPLEENVTQVHAGITFEPDSLGWLAKYFLRHHPEIRYGIFPGCAVALIESMRIVVERGRS